jgi:hypothetical protein
MYSSEARQCLPRRAAVLPAVAGALYDLLCVETLIVWLTICCLLAVTHKLAAFTCTCALLHTTTPYTDH